MDNLVKVTKAWVDAEKNFGSKEHYFNPATPFEGIEPCYLKNNNKVIECTKIFYQSGKFITLIGTPEEFFVACREANVAWVLLTDIYRAGLTIKQFMQQNERLNGFPIS